MSSSSMLSASLPPAFIDGYLTPLFVHMVRELNDYNAVLSPEKIQEALSRFNVPVAPAEPTAQLAKQSDLKEFSAITVVNKIPKTPQPTHLRIKASQKRRHRPSKIKKMNNEQ